VTAVSNPGFITRQTHMCFSTCILSWSCQSMCSGIELKGKTDGHTSWSEWYQWLFGQQQCLACLVSHQMWVSSFCPGLCAGKQYPQEA
jgi:hypothetical protein